MPNPETFEQGSPAYLNECAGAVEPHLLALIENAVKAGWNRRKVVLAIHIAAGEYLNEPETAVDLDDLPFIGPRPSDTLN
jgi:hypothetical protein